MTDRNKRREQIDAAERAINIKAVAGLGALLIAAIAVNSHAIADKINAIWSVLG